MAKFALIAALVFFSTVSYAFTVEEKLPDPLKEKQAEQLFHEIKCLVCTGESLSESNAELAVDMRALIRKKLAEGKTPEEIKSELAETYGDQILQTPPFRGDTYLLWFAPLILLAAGGFAIIRNLNARRN